MKKGIGYYMRSYLKSNALVLFFELIVIVLLALVCTMLLGGTPLWLGPVMAFVAYLLAELRFMMAYVASNLSKDAKQETTEGQSEAEEPEDDLFAGSQTVEPDEDGSYEEYTPPAPIFEEIPVAAPQDSVFAEPAEPSETLAWDEPAPVAVPETPSALDESVQEGDIDDEPDLPVQSSLDLGE